MDMLVRSHECPDDYHEGEHDHLHLMSFLVGRFLLFGHPCRLFLGPG